MIDINPMAFAVPIIKWDLEKQKVAALLGTGFFTGTPPVVVTAKHVFRSIPWHHGEVPAAIRLGQPEFTLRLIGVNDIRYSGRYDVAAFFWPDPLDVNPLPFARNRISPTQDVVMIEFGQSDVTPDSTSFRAVTHKGNVMVYYARTWPQNDGTPVFDTSFPAIQGASGAPVMAVAAGFPVVGMAIGNIQRHLLPVQVVRVSSEDEHIDETHYYLPSGQALEGKIIVEFLESIGVRLWMLD